MRRLAAIVGLLAVLILLPVGLLNFACPPFVPSINLSGAADSLRGDYIAIDAVIRGLGLVCWLAWGYLLLVVLLRIAARVVEKASPRAGASLRAASDTVTPRWMRRTLDFALSGSLMISALSGVAVSRPVDYGHVLSVAHIANLNHTNHEVEFDRGYVVKPGDSLWDIAEEQLGSGYRWREIYELNRGRSFSDGRSLVNPRLIHPGWVLTIPGPAPSQPEVPATPPRVERPPDPSPAPSVTANSDRPPTTREQEQAAAPRDARPLIELPSGGVVAASFASGILAAQALSALRRRRSRKALADPDEGDEPPLVLDLRRQVEVAAAGHLEAAASEVAALWQRVNHSLPRFPIALEERNRAVLYVGRSEGASTVIPPSTSRIVFRDEGQLIRAEVGRPFPPKPVRQETLPATGMFIPMGAKRGTAVHLGVLAAGGLSVTGPRAAPFATQALLSCAADTACEDLEIYLIGDEPLLGSLRDLNHVRASTSWEGADDVLQRIQVEILRRARLFAEEGVDDLWSYCAADRDEPLPAVLIAMTEPPQGMLGIAEAVSAQAMNLGVGMIAVGWTAAPIPIVVDVDRRIRLKTPLPRIPEHLAPLHLSPEEISQAVVIINSARPVAWETNLVEAEPTESEEEKVEQDLVVIDVPPTPDAEKPPTPKIVVNEEPAALTDEIPLRPGPGQLEVRTFGNLVIVKDGRIVEKGLRAKAREVLAFLVAHPQGISKERIWDVLWPDADPNNVRLDLNRSLYNLRQRMGKDKEHVTRIRDICRLELDDWWADAVAFESQLSKAGSLAAEEAIETLSDALDLYSGQFCDDCYFSWLEPVRDRYRSMFVKSSARLSNLLMQYDRTDEAIVALDRAIEVDLVNEDLYRRAMAIEGRLGRRKAVQQRFSKLGAILQDELDADPDDETASLFRKIMSDLEGARKSLRQT